MIRNISDIISDYDNLIRKEQELKIFWYFGGEIFDDVLAFWWNIILCILWSLCFCFAIEDLEY
jgi:hypothetical protein